MYFFCKLYACCCVFSPFLPLLLLLSNGREREREERGERTMDGGLHTHTQSWPGKNTDRHTDKADTHIPLFKSPAAALRKKITTDG